MRICPVGPVVGEDGWAVPAGCARTVLGFLVEEHMPAASDGEPGGHMAGRFARTSEYLLFAQHEPCCGGEVDGPGLPQIAAGGTDQRLGQPVELRVLCHGQVYVVGGVFGRGASQGEGRGGGGDVEGRALLGGGFDAQPVAAEGGAHGADDAHACLGAARAQTPEFEGPVAVEDGQGGGAAPDGCCDAGGGPYSRGRCPLGGRRGVFGARVMRGLRSSG